jgi:cell division protein FtsI/penicillin-binding protein 2
LIFVLRREAMGILLAAVSPAGAGSLERFFGGGRGTAILVDVPRRRMIAVHGAAGALLAPPGSTLKPLVLAALLRARKMDAAEAYSCPRVLTIAGRQFNCSHPALAGPLRIPEALAYSCNCFAAHFAARFGPGELTAGLERAGLAVRSGWLGEEEVAGRVRATDGRDGILLEALGEEGVLATPAGLAAAYRSLSLSAPAPIREGLEGAVEFGTAQRAQVEGLGVAGKTGSVRSAEGARIAWFAGFAPSRDPRVAVAVALQGRSGGADAAPVAGRILAAYQAGRL